MKRVTGIGGFFFKCQDADAQRAWYAKHLGVPVGEYGIWPWMWRDLEALVAALREEGVEVVGEIEEHPNGKFGWILDPEGNKIELWEPKPDGEDPYMPPA